MAEEMDINNEDVFMSEILDSSECNDDSFVIPFGINSLLREPLKLNSNKLDFNDSQTPRIRSANDRKRKNPTRRCLSTDLVNTSFTTPEVLFE
jgi:hypothetical protein